MSRKLKRNLRRIIISLFAFLVCFVIDLILGLDTFISDKKIAFILPLGLYLTIYLYIGYDVLWRAIRNIIRGQVFDENFLMCLATIGAFGIGEFSEGVAVLLFYQIGEWFQSYAVGKSRKSISELMDIRPDYANIVLPDGTISMVSPEEVRPDDIIIVKPGEKIPLDGIVVRGSSSLDTKALTGESIPREVEANCEVISGTLNLSGVLEIRVTKPFYDSTVSKILELVENASSNKSSSENFISRFAKYYTPIIVIGALILFLAPGIITGNYVEWLKRSLNFLVVSCPCALVISIPLTFFAGIGGASRYGILVKGSSYLESFSKANIFVFDKTGTLTKGNFVISKFYPEEKKDELLALACIAEVNSNHPIAMSIIKEYEGEIDLSYELTDIPGKGIVARGEDTIYCGNSKLMDEFSINYSACSEAGTVVYVAKNKEFIGYIVIADEIKSEAFEMMSYLNKINAHTVMLTGDNEIIASNVAIKLGIKEYRANLLPVDKVEIVNSLMDNKQENSCLCFLGDGINDAPVLMSSDIGISMGAIGSDAAIEASDIVLMYDDLRGISIAKKISRKTMRIVKENIIFALGVKAAILILSIFGLANMWLAIFADVGVSIICILNAMRTNSKYK